METKQGPMAYDRILAWLFLMVGCVGLTFLLGRFIKADLPDMNHIMWTMFFLGVFLANYFVALAGHLPNDTTMQVHPTKLITLMLLGMGVATFIHMKMLESAIWTDNCHWWMLAFVLVTASVRGIATDSEEDQNEPLKAPEPET